MPCFQVKGEKKPLVAKFYGDDKRQRCTITSEKEMNKVLKELEGAEYSGAQMSKRESGARNRRCHLRPVHCSRKPANVLNYSTQKTMRLAQQLYEGIDIKGNGTVGLITYLRTDSVRISEEADAICKGIYQRAVR